MSGGWATSNRRSRLPADWGTVIVPSILARDGHRCTVVEHGERCPSTVDLEVDHIQRGDDHRPENLATKCSYHHGLKTAQEGNEAKAKKKAQIHNRFRRREEHPASAWR